jgi:trk system potassium uptake protein TrkH
MILFGVNFSVYFFLLCKKYKLAWLNSELKCYIGIILTAIFLITVNVMTTGGYFSTVGEAIHHVVFSVGSVITTTGYGTVDFAKWPEFSRVILVLLMIVGACAGSTGGGMKVSRVLILFKSQARELRRMIHPHAVEIITMDKKKVDKSAIGGTAAFLSVYFVVMLVSIALLSLDSFGTETTVTAVMATLNNIGPGTSAIVGPFGGYGAFSPLSKLVMIFDMLCGRLELFPMLLLLRPSTWRKH